MKVFLESKYLICFSGSDQGVIGCRTAEGMQSVLRDLYPNPGCPDHAALTNPDRWEPSREDGFPYMVERTIDDDERGATVVRVYRVVELAS